MDVLIQQDLWVKLQGNWSPRNWSKGLIRAKVCLGSTIKGHLVYCDPRELCWPQRLWTGGWASAHKRSQLFADGWSCFILSYRTTILESVIVVLALYWINFAHTTEMGIHIPKFQSILMGICCFCKSWLYRYDGTLYSPWEKLQLCLSNGLAIIRHLKPKPEFKCSKIGFVTMDRPSNSLLACFDVCR